MRKGQKKTPNKSGLNKTNTMNNTKFFIYQTDNRQVVFSTGREKTPDLIGGIKQTL